MCLIVFAWRPGHDVPLVVASNRDEFHARPTAPLARWEDAPLIRAGRDLEAGGTWLGVDDGGRFATVTNIRGPAKAPGKRSRGELPERFLRGDLSPADYLADLVDQTRRYAGFNLLVGDRDTLCYFNSEEGVPRPLEPGLYGLCNARLDTPWPKLVQARAGLEDALNDPTDDRLLALLADRQQAADGQLPQTGVTVDWERVLSSIFIAGPLYGTRSSLVLRRDAEGRFEGLERRFGPNGIPLGETRL